MPKKPAKALISAANVAVHVNGASHGNGSLAQPFQGQYQKVGSLNVLRKVTQHTQDDLAIAMGVGQGTISRIEKRRDMLISTLQHYVESMGGKLNILATFPDCPPLVIECLGKTKKTARRPKARNKKSTSAVRQAGP